MDLLDIDECTANTDRCADICVNTPGSYSCFCRPGYVLNSDGYNCNGENHTAYIIITLNGRAHIKLHS